MIDPQHIVFDGTRSYRSQSNLNHNCGLVVISKDRVELLIEFLSQSELERFSEIIVVADHCGKTIDALKVEKHLYTKLIKSSRQLGVGCSREIGSQYVKSNIIAFIDDDTFFTQFNLQQLLNEFSEETCFLIQGEVFAADGKAKRSNEQPFIFQKYRKIENQEISYFVGTCHFVKKDLFCLLGGYRNSSLYGFEELRLSLNAIEQGYKMKICKHVAVAHLKAPGGRLDREKLFKVLLSERVKISNDFYPKPFDIVQKIYWNIKLFTKIKNIVWHTDITRKKMTYRTLFNDIRYWSRIFA